MDILSQLNSPVLYLICGGIIFFVALVCVFFMVRAYRAGVAIGMDKTKMKRTITASATFAALPSVGILLGVIALSGSLGTPWSWLRLSVIGALHYETQVAEAAAEAVGLPGLSASAMTPQAFTTIALLMGVCIMWGMVFSIFFNKKYLSRLKAPKKNGAAGGGFGDTDGHVHRSRVRVHRQLHRRSRLRRGTVHVCGKLDAACGRCGVGGGDGGVCMARRKEERRVGR